MRWNTTVEQFDASPVSEDAAFFKEALKQLEAIRKRLVTFANEPESPHGVANLADASSRYTRTISLYGQENAPFSHHSLSRLRNSVGVIVSHYNAVLSSGDKEADFRLGRQTEQAIERIERIIEEWKMCLEYMEKT